MVRSVVLIAASWLALASAARADGKLDRARDEIREGGDHDDDHDRDRASDEDDDDSWAGDLIVGIAQALFSDGGDDDDEDEYDAATGGYEAPPLQLEVGFSRYPYERDDAAYVITLDRSLAYRSPGPHADVEPSLLIPRPRPLAGHIALEGGYWDGLARTGLSARLLTDTRFDIDVRSAWLHEPASDHTDVFVGDAHASLRFAQTDALLLRFALGARFWSDRDLDAVGFDGLLGLDLFPVRPLVVSAQIGGGNLGQAPVGNARIQLGIALQRFELLAGVEWLRIGDVDLSSPVLGMRLWL